MHLGESSRIPGSPCIPASWLPSFHHPQNSGKLDQKSLTEHCQHGITEVFQFSIDARKLPRPRAAAGKKGKPIAWHLIARKAFHLAKAPEKNERICPVLMTSFQSQQGKITHIHFSKWRKPFLKLIEPADLGTFGLLQLRPKYFWLSLLGCTAPGTEVLPKPPALVPTSIRWTAAWKPITGNSTGSLANPPESGSSDKKDPIVGFFDNGLFSAQRYQSPSGCFQPAQSIGCYSPRSKGTWDQSRTTSRHSSPGSDPLLANRKSQWLVLD